MNVIDCEEIFQIIKAQPLSRAFLNWLPGKDSPRQLSSSYPEHLAGRSATNYVRKFICFLFVRGPSEDLLPAMCLES
jgi:hypothetical protein